MARPEPAATIVDQRWFRAKGRPIEDVREIDRASLPPAHLAVLEVTFRDAGPAQRYLTLDVAGSEPGDGDGAWSALVALMGADGRVEGHAGTFAARRTAAFGSMVEEGAMPVAERRLRVEQSNTSVIVGGRAILKLFRLLEPGINPDLEIGAFLTDVGFSATPALGATLTWTPHGGAPCAAAMLQALVPSHADAWSAMGEVLRTEPGKGILMAAAIGRVTAELHAALASRPGPDFPVRLAGAAETGAWRAAAEEQLTLATQALEGRDRERLVRIAAALRGRFADAFGSVTGAARVTRIHGDLHLGQLLARPDGGFSVIDFEGEPARPPEERRRPASPLRDVAGLLRSLDYAAQSARREVDFGAGPWLAEARAALLDAYGTPEGDERALLLAFELEKACYEVRYEATNRPGWVWLPLEALERLAHAGV